MTKAPSRRNAVDIEARNREIVRLRNEDRLSLAGIGKLFPRNGKPLTKEGVRVILKNAQASGIEVLKVRGKTAGQVNKHTARAEERKQEARERFLAGESEPDITEGMSVCSKTLRGYLEDLPEYTAARRSSRRKPTKSTLSYEEIRDLRIDDKLKIREIAVEAGITPSRVSQVLQRQGLYEPTPATAERIESVMCMLSEGKSVREVADEVDRTPSQVYAYRSLGETLASTRPK